LSGAERIFQRMLETDPVNGHVPGFLSTHPNATERLQLILQLQAHEAGGITSELPAVLSVSNQPVIEAE